MRILHICAYSWSIGGPPKVIYDHAEVALRHGHSITIVSPLSPGEEVYTVPAGAEVITFPRTQPVSRFFREFSVAMYHYLKNNIHQFDVIHCHGLWHFGVLAPFLLDRRVAKVVTIHGLLDRWALRQSYWKKWLMSSLFQKQHLRRADLIHLINPDEKDDLFRHLGYQHPGAVVIPNGVRVSEFAQLPPAGTFRRAFSLPDHKKLVLFLSRLNRKKGLDLLLPAFKQYQEQNSDALLIIAGPDDGYEAQVRAFVAEYTLSDSVRLVGMLTGDLKRAALADADLFVLPSYSEGLSIAVLEAMAAGTPLLVSDRVGFGDVLQKRQAAYTVELTADSIRAGLATLLQNAPLRAQLATNARRLVAEEYDIDIVAERLLAEYSRIIRTKADAKRLTGAVRQTDTLPSNPAR